MIMPTNPILLPSPDPNDPLPLVEMKSHVLLFLDHPPGPALVRTVYDLFLKRFPGSIAVYRSTAFGSALHPWTPAARQRFENVELPDLRKRRDWGYGFTDAKPADARLFMAHGSKPATEPGKASFLRFEFEWHLDPAELARFAAELIAIVPCHSGFGGYVFQTRPNSALSKTSCDAMFALAHRYWGVEGHDLDVSLGFVLAGLRSISWLTIVGQPLAADHPEAMEAAKAAAFRTVETPLATLFVTEEKPRLIDRNRQEPLGNYPALATALLPMQIPAHGPLGGTRWDEDNTMRYLRRFTHPDEV